MRFSARPFSLALVLVSAAFPCHADDPAPEPAAVPPQVCVAEDVLGSALCASYPVWENRATKTGRKIPINIVILRATGAEGKAPDPIFYFAGGPGQAATTTAGGWAQAAALRERHDVVLVDQRGTGGSNGLECKFYGDPPDLARVASGYLGTKNVERCRAELEKKADLTQYTTEAAVDDFDEVRAWLGYDKIDVFGGSYGTTSAQAYLKRHPGSVRALVLDGVAPLDEPYPLHHAAAGQKAADVLFAECASDPACHAAFPHPGEELKAVMAKVEKGIEVEVRDPRDGKKVKVRPDRGVIADGIRWFLYGVEEGGKNTLPLRVHRASSGDYGPLVETALENRLTLDRVIAGGMWLSVTCAEDIPRIDPAIVARETANTFLGDYRVRTQTEACKVWPRGQVSPGFWDLPHSDVPALLISGERDPVTPSSFGDRVAKGLPNSLHLLVPHGGHGADNDCVNGITLAFLDQGSVKGLDTSCLAKSEPAKFATELPAPKEEAGH